MSEEEKESGGAAPPFPSEIAEAGLHERAVQRFSFAVSAVVGLFSELPQVFTEETPIGEHLAPLVEVLLAENDREDQAMEHAARSITDAAEVGTEELMRRWVASQEQ